YPPLTVCEPFTRAQPAHTPQGGATKEDVEFVRRARERIGRAHPTKHPTPSNDLVETPVALEHVLLARTYEVAARSTRSTRVRSSSTSGNSVSHTAVSPGARAGTSIWTTPRVLVPPSAIAEA